MKKVSSIHIQGVLFQIEEAAYADLEKYLASVSRHFKSYKDRQEIIDDIELRIAEKFQTEILSKKHTTITAKDVKSLIESMGKVDEISDLEAEEIEEAPRSGLGKRLYRDGQERILAGVSSGIGAYFGIDPIFIRLFFVITTLIWGWGILVYILLWIIVPVAQTSTQKLEMQGSNVTLSEIERNIKKKLNQVPKDSSKLVSFLREVADLTSSTAKNIFRLVKPFARIFLQVTGLFLVLGATFAIAAISFASFAVVTDMHQTFLSQPLQELISPIAGTPLLSLIGSLYFVILVPLILILMMGVSLIRLRTAFSWLTSIFLLILWLVAVGIFGLLSLNYLPPVVEKAQEIDRRISQQALENQVTQDFEIGSFEKLEVGGRLQVQLQQGNNYLVQVTTNQLNIDSFQPQVLGQTLKISDEQFRTIREDCVFFCPEQFTLVTITAPNIAELEVGDLAQVEVIGAEFTQESLTLGLSEAASFKAGLRVENLELEATDLSRVDLDLVSNQVKLNTSGSSRIDLAGQVDTLEAVLNDLSQVNSQAKIESLTVETSSTARADFADSPVQTADLKSHDISLIRVQVRQNLTAQANNASKIIYTGNPISVIKDTTEMGVVESQNK